MRTNNIVIAFPKRETALRIKKLLTQSGYEVLRVCTTGAQVLAGIEGIESGIIICAARFVDMMYTELYEYLPEDFQMLLISPYGDDAGRKNGRLVCLSVPFKVHELLQTLEAIEEAKRRKRRMRSQGRSGEEQAVIEQAKEVLMRQKGCTEEEAHRYIQKLSMDNGTALAEVAQMLLSLMEYR